MAVAPLDLASHHLPQLDEFVGAFEAIVRSGRFVGGPALEQFEAHLAEACGVEHAVGVSSGTDALLAALMALDIGPGDEVIVPPFTFFATAGCVARTGARPVFADIDPLTLNLDPRCAAAAVTDRTRAIIPVHLFGLMADTDAIRRVADEHGLAVIEDAAQAIGALDGGRPAGSVGDMGCFSFYPTKNLSAMGDAGAVLTDDPALAQRLRQLRNHGQTELYEHALVGGNFRLDAIQAAVLDLKLPHLERWNDARRRLARRYDEALASTPLVLPVEPAGKRHVYHQYTVRAPGEETGGGPTLRDRLREHLTAAGIGHGVFYPRPLHLQPCFAELGGKVGDCPVAEAAALSVLSLPIYPELSEAAQDEAIEAVAGFFG